MANKPQLPRLLLHAVALIALIYVLSGSAGPGWEMADRPDRVIEAGKWALRFLLFSLAMTPANTYLGWRGAITLRKPAGLWAFGFAALHFGLSYFESQPRGVYLQLPMMLFVSFGVVGLVILSAMAITSNQRAMRLLGKNWKRIHRLVYVAGGAIVVHAILATEASKRMFVRDPKAIYELGLYLALLMLLLALRLPFVRAALKRLAERRVRGLDALS